jgi:DNA-binding GntR family transcriptional regulator
MARSKATDPALAIGAGNLRYRLIAQSLATAIARGTHGVGARLPTEAALCRRFGASRFTVRQALATLRDKGLIASRRGIGTVVVAASSSRNYVESFGSVGDVIRHGLSMPLTVSDISDVEADAALAAALGCQAGNSFVLIQGLRYPGGNARGEPLGWTDAYVPAVYGDIRDRLPGLKTTIAQLIIETCGVSIASIDQEILPIAVPEFLAKRLRVKAGAPALQITRWYHDTDGSVFEIARSVYPAGRYTHRSRIMPTG